MQAAAFFDLDRTLLAVNSGTLWIKRERAHGRINLRQLADATAALLLYQVGFLNIDLTIGRALAHYRGEAEADLERWTREWFEAEVAHLFAPGGRAALADHRRRGHLCVLLTSSSRYMARLVTERLGLDAALCQGYEVKDGHFTGEPCRPLCFGPGKVTHAERFAAEHGIQLDSSYFYSDSYTDLPMLSRVGNPRVVNPDIRLRLAAWRRGWPVLDWSRLAL